jgi:large subunit ribosomal protein L3
MPGHMGSERVTVRNLEIVDVRTDQNILLIKGAIPGAIGTIVEIKKED